MNPVEITQGIYNVGVRDWNIRDFHGYSVYQGTTYNAYLIVDEKIVLIDTVKKDFADQLIDNITTIIDPQKIDLVISNHTEMDHSGGLPRVMHKIGEDKPLYCSKMGHKNLSLHFRQRWNYHAVANGEELSLGKRTLTFLETRMLHWPDSMFSYVKEDRLLFSSDAFGQHYAGPENFDDEIGEAIMPHARKYFANILLPLSPLIQKLVDQVSQLGLKFDIICPDHGIIWRKDPAKIINAYVSWSEQTSAKKAIVVYDTMWQSAQAMAEAIASGIREQGVTAKPIHLRSSHRSDIMTEVMDAKAIVVGSPTINNGLFPTVSDFLTYMKGLKPKNKIGAAFGSYGWSGEAVKLINQEFEAMKFDMRDPGLKIQFVPGQEDIEACIEFGRKIGNAIIR
ncbi:MAG: MBL fold metallo-hydrolase [Deltaproteobacteria bacterium CG1_02_45_11]|nr:MAG: MBL fold metallo-hydrolase [Deltaproteobacteria bacterium CG1_02_45_11]